MLAATCFVLLGFGVLVALEIHTAGERPAVTSRNAVAYFAIVTFLGIGLLLGVLDLARTWAEWLRFAAAHRIPAQAEIRHLGERTRESGGGFETALTLRYAYPVHCPEGRERVFVAEERVSERESRRLLGVAAIPVLYDRARPARVRRR